MPPLKHLHYPFYFPVRRFDFGIFHQEKTSRKNWRVPCHAAAPRLFPCNRLSRREHKNCSFCMNANLCRNLGIS